MTPEMIALGRRAVQTGLFTPTCTSRQDWIRPGETGLLWRRVGDVEPYAWLPDFSDDASLGVLLGKVRRISPIYRDIVALRIGRWYRVGGHNGWITDTLEVSSEAEALLVALETLTGTSHDIA